MRNDAIKQVKYPEQETFKELQTKNKLQHFCLMNQKKLPSNFSPTCSNWTPAEDSLDSSSDVSHFHHSWSFKGEYVTPETKAVQLLKPINSVCFSYTLYKSAFFGIQSD